jgi:hypothetical protein
VASLLRKPPKYLSRRHITDLVVDYSPWILVALGVLAVIQGWANFGPWVYRKIFPADFVLTLGEGGNAVTRTGGTGGSVTVRIASQSRRPIKVQQIFQFFSEQLDLQGFTVAGIPLIMSGPLPVLNIETGGRYRSVAAPAPIYFSKGDVVLYDLILKFPASGDYELRLRIWPEDEPVVASESMRINVAPP